MTSKFDRFLPLAGVIAGLLFAAAGVLTNEPGISATAQTHITWFHQHKTVTIIAGVASGYFFVAMVLYAGALRSALRSRDGAPSPYGAIAFAGALAVAAAVLANGLSQLIGLEAADKGQSAVVMTMAYYDDLGWLPWAAGSAVLFLTTGIGGVATRALPKWLSIVTIVLGVMSLAGPTGILVWFITPVWLVVTAVLLRLRLRSTAADASRAPAGQFVAA